MRTIDNTIKYIELLMSYDDTSQYINYELPVGYHYEYYKPGNEIEWAEIQVSTAGFSSIDKALETFHKYFDYFIDELNKRCLFIVEDSTNKKIGTVTISLLEKEEKGYQAAVDWVAIRDEYQGRKLARPLITKCIELANELGHKKIILHTQTTTWLAAKLYLDAGFEPLNKEEIVGWKILKRLTNHPKLNNYDLATDEEMYDLRNIAIQKELDKIYEPNTYNFSEWHKDGLHNVYVYHNGISDEYEYFIDDNHLRLEKINKEDNYEQIKSNK